MNRFQTLLPSGTLTLVGIWITWVSYTQEPAAAFMFPRLVATLFLILAAWSLINAILGLPDDAPGVSKRMFKNMIPGIIVGAIYIFWMAAGARRFRGIEGDLGFYLSKGLGFYTATAIAMFTIVTLYDPAPHNRVGTWVRRAIITAVFTTVMYLLFSTLLSVYTPRETLF
ncbi:MAG: tripartite tricarboxylate transporter TctB family protein [Planktomarina sp.]